MIWILRVYMNACVCCSWIRPCWKCFNFSKSRKTVFLISLVHFTSLEHVWEVCLCQLFSYEICVLSLSFSSSWHSHFPFALPITFLFTLTVYYPSFSLYTPCAYSLCSTTACHLSPSCPSSLHHFHHTCRGGAEIAEAPCPAEAGVCEDAAEAGGDGEAVLRVGRPGLSPRLHLPGQWLLHQPPAGHRG